MALSKLRTDFCNNISSVNLHDYRLHQTRELKDVMQYCKMRLTGNLPLLLRLLITLNATRLNAQMQTEF